MPIDVDENTHIWRKYKYQSTSLIIYKNKT